MDPLREAARRDGLGPAVEGPAAADGAPVRWRWSELDLRADSAALRLAEAGVRPGDTVAVLLPSSPEAMVLLHALPRAGALVAPLHSEWTEAELALALSALGRPRLLLVPGARVSDMRRALPEVGTVAVEEIAPAGREEWDPEPDDPRLRAAMPEPAPETPVALVLTSGSTGHPRPIPLTHENLLRSARGVADRLRLDSLDTWLAVLSPAHVGGLALLHRAAVVGSGTLTRPRFSADELLALAERGDITHVSVVPTMLQRLLELRGERDAPRALRCVLVGGAPAPAPVLEAALERRWPIALTYGLTEASSQVATAPPELVREKPGTVGSAIEGVEVRVSSSPGEEEGEILVRGATVAPVAPWPGPGTGPSTERPSAYVDAAGWLHTGDRGRHDTDGHLWVTGRNSNRILSGGVTVEPAEVEGVLLGHPDVAEAGVTSVPDPEWGERVVALLVPSASGALEPRDVLSYAQARLAPAKWPREVAVVEALPRTPTGKLDRPMLARVASRLIWPGRHPRG